MFVANVQLNNESYLYQNREDDVFLLLFEPILQPTN